MSDYVQDAYHFWLLNNNGALRDELDKRKACMEIQALTNVPSSKIRAKIDSLTIQDVYGWNYWASRIKSMAAVGQLSMEWFD